MARIARVITPDYPHHITHCGNRGGRKEVRINKYGVPDLFI
jgi:hypothetical protein